MPMRVHIDCENLPVQSNVVRLCGHFCLCIGAFDAMLHEDVVRPQGKPQERTLPAKETSTTTFLLRTPFPQHIIENNRKSSSRIKKYIYIYMDALRMRQIKKKRM